MSQISRPISQVLIDFLLHQYETTNLDTQSDFWEVPTCWVKNLLIHKSSAKHNISGLFIATNLKLKTLRTIFGIHFKLVGANKSTRKIGLAEALPPRDPNYDEDEK